ncbi:uncharacterized protein LOC121627436 isoform X3 [Chelmon rostratus]|uniref:uncharacterized protein LOC121627436 isoform X2 n=1 Tax=Chelmon rostratus TaxID=109905 RepID=UPI001BE942A4|nr:uncharacterized protein LOC121627436 isoform X2 [Chelmon rostratus]XP_041822281.1 uncharacterized protein LOC121627436 isoform X3 [Chelmon rostratus]
MAKWKLCFVLLLPLTVCLCKQETLVKKAGSKSAVTPLCTNSTDAIITLIVCKVSTERSREECRLMYRHGDDFKNECESRFTLTKVNQTVFLQLSSLTPEDSGNLTCECSHPDGTDFLSLSITVEEGDNTTSPEKNAFSNAAIGVTIVIIITGVILGFIYRRIHHRRELKPQRGRPNSDPQDIEPYSTFIQRENGLYSTARVHVVNTNPQNANIITKEDTRTGHVL